MCDDSDSSFGEEHEMNYYKYSISDSLGENTKDKLYIWISDTNNEKIDFVEGIVF